jgi:hypothetical protein
MLSTYIALGLMFIGVIVLVTVSVASFSPGKLVPHLVEGGLLGFGLIAMGYGIVKWRLNRDIAEVDKEIARIKAEGEPVKVNLLDCGIKESSEMEDETDTGKPAEKRWEIIYKVQRRGITKTYVSRPLSLGRETLLFKLHEQKETTAYCDKDEPDVNYLDLDFLDA